MFIFEDNISLWFDYHKVSREPTKAWIMIYLGVAQTKWKTIRLSTDTQKTLDQCRYIIACFFMMRKGVDDGPKGIFTSPFKCPLIQPWYQHTFKKHHKGNKQNLLIWITLHKGPNEFSRISIAMPHFIKQKHDFNLYHDLLGYLFSTRDSTCMALKMYSTIIKCWWPSNWWWLSVIAFYCK